MKRLWCRECGLTLVGPLTEEEELAFIKIHAFHKETGVRRHEGARA